MAEKLLTQGKRRLTNATAILKDPVSSVSNVTIRIRESNKTKRGEVSLFVFPKKGFFVKLRIWIFGTHFYS